MKQATASYCGARPHERDTPPPAKRQKIWWDSDEEEEEEEERGFDPDTYYDKARNDHTTPEVDAFAKKVFRKCLSQDKRKELSKLYPRPSIEATQVPKADQLIVDFMAKDFSKEAGRTTITYSSICSSGMCSHYQLAVKHGGAEFIWLSGGTYPGR